MNWGEKRTLLITLGLLFVANLLFFLTYRVRYEQRVLDLEQKRVTTENDLARARTRRFQAERKARLIVQIEKDVTMIHEDWWATPEERLTALIVEIRRLGAVSGLVPQSIGYTMTPTKAASEADSMSISFSVQGPYPRVRQLVNLIELSTQFVTIDEVAIAGSAPDTLNLTLQLRTLFRPSDSMPVKARP